MSNYLRCGCEDGRDCTKTTMCHVQTAVEDYESEIEHLQERFDYAVKKNGEQWAEIKRLRRALDQLKQLNLANSTLIEEQEAENERLNVVLDACLLSNKEYEQANNELTAKIEELQK